MPQCRPPASVAAHDHPPKNTASPTSSNRTRHGRLQIIALAYDFYGPYQPGLCQRHQRHGIGKRPFPQSRLLPKKRLLDSGMPSTGCCQETEAPQVPQMLRREIPECSPPQRGEVLLRPADHSRASIPISCCGARRLPGNRPHPARLSRGEPKPPFGSRPCSRR